MDNKYFTECNGCFTQYDAYTASRRSKPDGKCDKCQGSGKIYITEYSTDTCYRCKGTGVCPGCGGSGIISAKLSQ